MVGSGQFVTPRERMHWLNLRMALVTCCTIAGGQLPVSSHCRREAPREPLLLGYRCWQARWAAWSCELLTPSCCELALGTSRLLGGSGKSGTPLERMQRE